MLLLNFGPALSAEQLRDVGGLLGEAPTVQQIAGETAAHSLMEHARTLVEAAGLTSLEWQTLPLVIHPPPDGTLALALLAALEGRCGYRPLILNVPAGPAPGHMELLNLQARPASP